MGNSYNVAFTSDGTEKLHASVKFTEPNKYGYKAEITEVKDGQSVLSTNNIQYNEDGTFTIAQSTLQALANKLTPENNMPATNEVSITFKLTSTDTSLNNTTTNITQTFNFIKAFKFDKSNIEALIQTSTTYQLQFDETPSGNQAHFAITNGKYNANLNTFTFTEIDNDLLDTDDGISKSLAQRLTATHIRTGKNKHCFKSVTIGEATEKDTNTLEFDLTLVFEDVYETDITMPIILVLTKSKGLFKP